MAAPDLEVIKDIPGYKVILKAVIKAQIQQLVEQLAVHTDEESVILTASVADGTLSHLGSDSGKGFLEEQEDVKTQFLGFCLRRHHKKMQAEKEKEKQKAMAQLPGQFDMGPGPRRPRMPYHSGPRHSFSPQGFIRSPGSRHEPYNVRRPGRRTSSETSFTETSQNPLTMPAGLSSSTEESSEKIPMKTEPSDDNQNSDLANKDEDSSNLSVPSLTNDQSEVRTGDDLDADTVKVEAISESEFELEITGVEPGRPAVPQDNWGPDVSMGMNFDSPQGASGSPADLAAQQGYNDLHGPGEDGNGSLLSSQSLYRNVHICHICGKGFRHQCRLREHMKTHAGLRPWQCSVCGKHFSLKGNLKKHMVTHFMGSRQKKLNTSESENDSTNYEQQ